MGKKLKICGGGWREKNMWGLVRKKNKNMWGVVGDFFSIPPPSQDLKWNSPQ